MVQGPMEALTGSIGDELNALAGGVTTRSTTIMRAERRIVGGDGLGPAGNGASSVAGTIVTFPVGTIDLSGVQLGDIFRVLSATTLTVTESAITAIGALQVTLTGAGLGAAVSSVSYEIVRPSETTLAVESTLELHTPTATDPGLFFAEDTLYRYTGVTATSLTGVQYLDAQGTFVDGTPEDLAPLTEILDYTESFSAIDTLRRSIFVRTATNEDLDALGRNLGVRRAPTQTDSQYRQLIEVMAYTHRGTIKAIEDALTVLVGAGNFEVFEDLTGGNEPDGSSDETLNNLATVFIRIGATRPESFNGKAFTEGFEYAELNANRTSTDINAAIQHPSEARVLGIQLAPDPLPEQTVVRGTAGSLAAGPTSAQFTAAAGAVFDGVVGGDHLLVEAGSLQSSLFVVSSVNVANTVLTLTPGDTLRDVLPTNGTYEITNWRIVREASQFNGHRPSDEGRELYPDSGTVETVYEYTGVAEGDVAVGAGITWTAGPNRQTYRRRARLITSTQGYVEFDISGSDATFNANPRNQVFQINDGTRTLTYGFANVSSMLDFGVLDNTTLAFLSTSFTNPVPDVIDLASPVRFTLRIEKDGTREWRIFVNGNHVQTLDYDVAALSAAPVSATPAAFEFGVFTNDFVADAWTLHGVDYQLRTLDDFFNHVVPATVTTSAGTTTTLTDSSASGLFTTDIESVRIQDWNVANAAGGLPLGEWVIDSVTSTDVVEITGRRYPGARTRISFDDIIFVQDTPGIFKYPDHKGASIELLTGPNAGVYAISELLYDDLTPVEPAATAIPSQTKAVLDANKAANAFFESPLQAQVSAVRVSNPPTGGFSATDRIDFRLIPGFTAQTVVAEIIGTGSFTSPTITHDEVVINHDPPNSRPLMQVRYGTTLSAQVWNEVVRNAARGTTGLTHYNFYLFDNVGYIADFVDVLTAAGVIPEHYRLTRDAAGLHITS